MSFSDRIVHLLLVSLTFVLLLATHCQGQVGYTNNQLSINASKFVLIFNEGVDNLDMTYRRGLRDSITTFRIATSLDLSTSADAVTDFSIRLGVDRLFLESGSWKFYSGVDLNYGRVNAKSAERVTTRIGILPFVGFLFHMGKHFSVSTEPSLAIFRNKIEDANSFNPASNTSNYSLELINLGQIKVGFHF